MSRWPGPDAGMAQHGERGSISLYIVGLAMVAIVLITGTVAVTSAQVTRMQVLDVADGAALAAANALDRDAYEDGVRGYVPVSTPSVRKQAAAYLAVREPPPRVSAWRLTPATGAPDGRTALVGLTARIRVPLIGAVLEQLGGEVTISVESRARAGVNG
ncbi:MAG: pilus assembly protein TadG-related protein [Dermatophilaceae bacterium]